MRDVKVHWLRASRNFIVKLRDGTALVRGIEDIDEAWLVADAEQRAIDAQRAAIERKRQEIALVKYKRRKGSRIGGAGVWH